MKMHDECIPCLVSQVIKTAHLTGAQDHKTNPEVAGDTYANYPPLRY